MYFEITRNCINALHIFLGIIERSYVAHRTYLITCEADASGFYFALFLVQSYVVNPSQGLVHNILCTERKLTKNVLQLQKIAQLYLTVCSDGNGDCDYDEEKPAKTHANKIAFFMTREGEREWKKDVISDRRI